MDEKDPYRTNPTDEIAKKFEAEIVREGKVAVRLPDNLIEGTPLPELKQAWLRTQIKNIALYSATNGIFHCAGEQVDYGQPTTLAFSNSRGDSFVIDSDDWSVRDFHVTDQLSS